ncbi:hypothetical protein X797_008354 [Metarhizium robertsii]|uniref:Uncharacterized protein n=1 Tax=Metarhizium robertsii TaxID=568076 RepID=A0A014NBN6_9HYPO|nr:hypothetical protein X797_008354 [Metarhizium robertsii]
MKVLGFLTALLATAGAVAATPPGREARMGKLHQQPDIRLQSRRRQSRDVYPRGGGITLFNIISSVCLAIIQWQWDPHSVPKPSLQEAEDWRICTQDLIKTFDTPASGDEAACRMWACLHNHLGKYNRGGVVTKTSKLLTPLCNFNGLIPVRIKAKEAGRLWDVRTCTNRGDGIGIKLTACQSEGAGWWCVV